MRHIFIILGIILSLMLSSVCLAGKATEKKESKSYLKYLKPIKFKDKNSKNISFTLKPTSANISISF